MLPVVIASAVVGPIATTGFGLMSTASGAGMGTAGFVGVFGVLEASAGSLTLSNIWLAIVLLMFVLPALIAGLVAWWMRRMGWIAPGDMTLP
nr:PTS sugar transporter subunit IIC [Psychrobacter sp. PraFG1]UNK05359.1 PTS sugar transporter subunit IIC [Psychrobacter sp. PraFG1]